MRFDYEPDPEANDYVLRPCVRVLFHDDAASLPHLALVDTGSPLTLMDRRIAESLHLGEPIGETTVACAQGMQKAVLYLASMEVVSGAGDSPIHLGDVTVGAINAKLPFVILGTNALVMVVIRICQNEAYLEVDSLEGQTATASMERP